MDKTEKTLLILLDTSTKHESATSQYGHSIVCWAGWWNTIAGTPARVEVYSINREGPNKTFFDGIIRALHSCFYMCSTSDHIVIYGDLQNHLLRLQSNQPYAAESPLRPFYNSIKKLERDLRTKKNCTVSYRYLNEKYETYKVIDQISKEARKFLNDRFKKIAPINKPDCAWCILYRGELCLGCGNISP
jgi:hypothetical protein